MVAHPKALLAYAARDEADDGRAIVGMGAMTVALMDASPWRVVGIAVKETGDGTWSIHFYNVLFPHLYERDFKLRGSVLPMVLALNCHPNSQLLHCTISSL